MYEDIFKSLPGEVNKEWMEKNYFIRLSSSIDDAYRQAENGNVSGAMVELGKIKELSDALFDLRNSIDKK